MPTDGDKIDRILEVVTRTREELAELRGANLPKRVAKLEERERDHAIEKTKLNTRVAAMWAGAGSLLVFALDVLGHKAGLIK